MIGQNKFLIAAQLPIIIKCIPQAEPQPTKHTVAPSVTACDWSHNRAGLEKT